MDELITEFLVEAGESLDLVDQEMIRFEAAPDDAQALNTIFRLVHTVKGTSGFLGLARLEAVTHAAETLLGKFRDGVLPVTPEAVTQVLAAVDRVKVIMAGLAETGAEPEGDDAALIARIDAVAEGRASAAPPAQDDAPFPGVVWVGDPVGAEPAQQDGSGDGPAPAVADASAPEPAPDEREATEDHGARGADRKAAPEQSIRVGVDVLEDMMTLISELVLTRNQLLQINRNHAEGAFSPPLQRLSAITGELQDSIMKTRMQPIGQAWKKLPRLVRDLAQDVGKQIRLELEGEATELDRQVLELIRDPLTHMVRNSADHGLETPADRLAAGKPATGVIRLSAAHESGSVVIAIEDDGRGLDAARIRAKAVAKGLIAAAEAEAMPEAQVLRLIFAPGFSTAEAVTHLSGRGVGMDVVRTNIEQIGGQVDLHSTLGKGTRFVIRIPLTLAIMDALVVRVGDQRFAVPQSSVVELVRAREGGEVRFDTIGGARLLRLRDRLLPIVALGGALEMSAAQPDFVVVATVAGRSFGVLVDEVLDTEEIVVKPLSARLRGVNRFSGATILGDGSVILIVELNCLAELAGEAPRGDAEGQEADAWLKQAADDDATLLLVEAGGARMVVDLSRVTRLEHIPAGRFEQSGGRMVLRYRGRLMPILPLGDAMMRFEGAQPLIVLNAPGGPVGLAVDRIVDILREGLVIELQPDRIGVLGAAVVAGSAAEVVDVDHFASAAAACFSDGAAPSLLRGVAA